MPSTLRHLTIDCADHYSLAQFWQAALGFVEDPDDPNLPEHPEALIVDPTGRRAGLLFIPVPEPKTVKNRLHLDLSPDSTRDEEVERLIALGATLVDDRRRPDGTGWVVLADPEGNELCVERSSAEKDETVGAGEISPRDTGHRPMPADRTADERTTLEQMLEWYREGVLAKVVGVSQAGAVTTPGASSSSIAGIVKHLAVVEDGWFAELFGGRPDPWAHVDWDADPDWEFRTAREEPLESSVELYRQACARSRADTAGLPLDRTATTHRGQVVSLRWVLLHMVEETARHLGHLDLLRELADGTVGD